MRANELKKLLDRRPFQPIRLHVSSGETVEVRHPEMAIVSKSLIAVGVNGSGGVADHIVHYNLVHVVQIEPLNGQRSAAKRSRPQGN